MPATWKKLAFEDDVVKHSLATAANDFLVASGSGVIIKKTLAETKTILGLPAPYAILQNRQLQNVGGGTATSGSWLIIPLNTEQEDADGIVDFSAPPAFTLAAGTYLIEAVSPFAGTVFGQARLYNVTDAAEAIIGSSVRVYSGYTFNSHLVGTVVIVASKQFRLEYRVHTTAATNGLGWPCNFGVEVYAQVKITKIK